MLQCDWASDVQCGTLNQQRFKSHKIRYTKFCLSEYLGLDIITENCVYREYLDAAGLTATVLRSKRTGEHLEKLNVLHCDPSSLYKVESCCSFISSF